MTSLQEAHAQELKAQNLKFESARQDSNQLVDLKLKHEGIVDRLKARIDDLEEQLARLKDIIQGKDAAIEALSNTLFDKGEENKRYAEMVSEFKNHQLITHVLNHKYAAERIGQLKNDQLLVSYESIN
jgi:archaellum component FlaC